ncbi:MAG: hypothetical protein M5R40_26085 [Anaerolineae bacterium]|nr:hypothetical protein [Anaerolineae bacterium]
MMDEHLAALDFPSLEAFLREGGAIFGPKLWFVRFERLSRLDATPQ